MQSIIFLLMKYYWPAWSTGLNQTLLPYPKPFAILEVSGVDQIPPDPGFVYAFCISLRLLLYPSSTFSEFFYHYINFVNLLQFLCFGI